MKRFIGAEVRTQFTLLPECLDDYVTEENSVRVEDSGGIHPGRTPCSYSPWEMEDDKGSLTWAAKEIRSLSGRHLRAEIPKGAAIGQQASVPSLLGSNMRKILTVMAMLALTGCSTHTGQTGQMIVDSAKDGDVLGAGIMSVALPFMLVMDVVTLGDTSSDTSDETSDDEGTEYVATAVEQSATTYTVSPGQEQVAAHCQAEIAAMTQAKSCTTYPQFCAQYVEAALGGAKDNNTWSMHPYEKRLGLIQYDIGKLNECAADEACYSTAAYGNGDAEYQLLMACAKDYKLSALKASGNPDNQTAEVVGGNQSGLTLASGDCETRKQIVINTKIPDNASVTSSNETVMFMTKTAIDMIDGGCPGGTPQQRIDERKQYLDAYSAAEDACNAVQFGERKCAPQKHY